VIPRRAAASQSIQQLSSWCDRRPLHGFAGLCSRDCRTFKDWGSKSQHSPSQRQVICRSDRYRCSSLRFLLASPIDRCRGGFPPPIFAAAFATDLAYWRTADVLWETFSDWLITAGMVTAGIGVVGSVRAARECSRVQIGRGAQTKAGAPRGALANAAANRSPRSQYEVSQEHVEVSDR
jgi:hypothetical protein